MEPDEALKSGCMQVLADRGFRVWPIPPVAQARSPDFGANKSDQDFIFELKERDDDPAALTLERETLLRGDVASSVESIGPHYRVSDKCRDGVKQLKAHSESADEFRLLWLHAAGRDPEIQVEQFRATLYGIANLFGLDSSHLVRCYFFHESEFHRHRADLAGAVISTPESFQLCLNTHYVRADEFRDSALVKIFHDALLDPARAERQGLLYIADCTNPRSDTGATIDYLAKKYHRQHLQEMPLHNMSARIMVGPGGVV